MALVTASALLVVGFDALSEMMMRLKNTLAQPDFNRSSIAESPVSCHASLLGSFDGAPCSDHAPGLLTG